MKEVTLDVESRKLESKGILSALRKGGKIPAVFYGKNIKSLNLCLLI
ncbi:MAG: hypothetical protein LE178_05630 [Endomicrobium sp.]|jgi:large subunit ribosomal protein L25|nr:hypothetical protein [Endomicrobium sp.]